ncbi:hypothetical protein C2845_PM05G20320 [Panicum miliaceum]|uniref:Uncharacterized protein n=1 Tax=Panicum miliaceum TaxID=4540 RepID=A0A3L6SZV7_PANMI|nr:hypothetical protein C2845_PM05G20320 [Panicum miliaceum]
MEIDEDDAPYLNLHSDHECQAYGILKRQSFGHTKSFDPELPTKIVACHHSLDKRRWLQNFKVTGPIECTSLITRIASSIGALEENNVSFIEGDRVFIDEAYLVQGHILKKGSNDSLIFSSLGYANEIRCQKRGAQGAVPSLARRTTSSRDFGSITQQLGELRVQATHIEDALHQHIENNQACQQYTGEKIHAMEQRSYNSRRSGGLITVGEGLTLTNSSEPETSLGEDPHREGGRPEDTKVVTSYTGVVLEYAESFGYAHAPRYCRVGRRR